MKSFFFVYFNLVLALISIGQNPELNKNITGTYIFETNRGNYNLNEKDTSFFIEKNSCCSEKWILKLRDSCKFELNIISFVDDSIYEYSFGKYVINGEFIHLYSPLPDKSGIIKPMSGKISKSLFKISLTGSFINNTQIAGMMDGMYIYTLDNNFTEKELTCLYTIPKRELLNDFENPLSDTISFVFKRKDIDKYLFYYSKNAVSSISSDSVILGSLLIDLSKSKSNNYFIGTENKKFDKGYFSDVSTFKLLIKNDRLITMDKYYNIDGIADYYEFIKQK